MTRDIFLREITFSNTLQSLSIKNFLFIPLLMFLIVINICSGQESNFKIIRNNNLYGLIDSKSNPVIPAIYDSIYSYKQFQNGIGLVHSNLFWVKKNNLWSLFNGNIQLTDFIYSMHYAITENFIPVKTNGKWGAIDSTGKVIFKPTYTWVKNMDNGICLVQNNDSSFSILDRMEKSIFPFNFKDVLADLTDLWFLNKDGHVRIFLVKRRKLLNQSFDRFYMNGNKFHLLTKNGKYGFIKSNGDNYFIDAIYDSAKQFCEGLAAVKVGGKWGFIDTLGLVKIKPAYQNAGEFQSGLVSVQKNGKWGFIDKTGRLTVPFLFDTVNEFYYSKARVVKDETLYYLIKKNNKIIITDKNGNILKNINEVNPLKIGYINE